MNHLARTLACFILGFLLGSTVTTARIGGQIDELTHAKGILEERLAGLEEELRQVEKSLSQQQKPVVNSIGVEIEFADTKLFPLEEEALRLNVEKQVKEILKGLMGENTEELNPHLIPLMLENRLIEAEGHRFRLKVNLLILTEKIQLVIQAYPAPKNPG